MTAVIKQNLMAGPKQFHTRDKSDTMKHFIAEFGRCFDKAKAGYAEGNITSGIQTEEDQSKVKLKDATVQNVNINKCK